MIEKTIAHWTITDEGPYYENRRRRNPKTQLYRTGRPCIPGAPTRILAELMSDDTLDDAAQHDDCEDITWQSGLLDSPHELSTGLIVTRTDGTTREVVIEFEVDKHDQVSRWRVDLFDEGNLLDTNGLTDDGWR